jgi:hypothetical protein
MKRSLRITTIFAVGLTIMLFGVLMVGIVID